LLRVGSWDRVEDDDDVAERLGVELTEAVAAWLIVCDCEEVCVCVRDAVIV